MVLRHNCCYFLKIVTVKSQSTKKGDVVWIVILISEYVGINSTIRKSKAINIETLFHIHNSLFVSKNQQLEKMIDPKLQKVSKPITVIHSTTTKPTTPKVSMSLQNLRFQSKSKTIQRFTSDSRTCRQYSFSTAGSI